MTDPDLYDHRALAAKAADCPDGPAIIHTCMRLALLTGCPVERFYMPMRGNSHTFVCAIPDGEPSVAGHILPGQLLLDDLAEEEPG